MCYYVYYLVLRCFYYLLLCLLLLVSFWHEFGDVLMYFCLLFEVLRSQILFFHWFLFVFWSFGVKHINLFIGFYSFFEVLRVLLRFLEIIIIGVLLRSIVGSFKPQCLHIRTLLACMYCITMPHTDWTMPTHTWGKWSTNSLSYFGVPGRRFVSPGC